MTDEQYQRRFEKRKKMGAAHTRGYEGTVSTRGTRAYGKVARAGPEQTISLTRLEARLSKDLLALARLTKPAFGTIGSCARIIRASRP